MILSINTTNNSFIEISLKKAGEVLVVEKIAVDRTQAEKLLPAIEKILKKQKIKLKDLEKIEVENRGGSFTSLRIGVATANALGFSLGIPVVGADGESKEIDGISIVEPEYSGEPDIK
ncbi:MAG: tRNA (adenosine(37)-N6)-threonylcarbamoyltransferase complex dimerization subunit type 1 TsaB [Patescibacteria group bacterium]|jgi:tRNA threonylcarbamoyladenosine biosynthesis protein TsaB